MKHDLDRRHFLGAVLLSAAGGSAFAADEPASAERKIEPADLPLDKPGVWTLHFRYKPPRIITVDGFKTVKVPGQPEKAVPAKQVVWYMWFQVYNAPRDIEAEENGQKVKKRVANEPVAFIPEFELVTRDLNTRHLDEPQPFVFEQIKKYEDPTGILDLKTSITIGKRPIPPSLPDALPRMVSGVAIWTDMADRAPKTNKFSVYITGLSNGLATEQKKVPPADEVTTLIKRKTLKIDFLRPTDDNKPEITDIRPDETAGPAETWVYRTTGEMKKRMPLGEPPKGKE